MRLPVGPQAPQKIQQPLAVVPSLRSSAKPASCSPALRVILVASFGSARSFSALPENSRASSTGVGASGCAYGQESLRIGSGSAPPSAWYSARMRVKSPLMISMSERASPGGSAPFQCHCSQREELVSDPSSSAKQLVGKRNTSVLICVGSTSLCSPKLRQNSLVSVASGSMITRNLSFARAAFILALLGAAARGLKP